MGVSVRKSAIKYLTLGFVLIVIAQIVAFSLIYQFSKVTMLIEPVTFNSTYSSHVITELPLRSVESALVVLTPQQAGHDNYTFNVGFYNEELLVASRTITLKLGNSNNVTFSIKGDVTHISIRLLNETSKPISLMISLYLKGQNRLLPYISLLCMIVGLAGASLVIKGAIYFVISKGLELRERTRRRRAP